MTQTADTLSRDLLVFLALLKDRAASAFVRENLFDSVFPHLKGVESGIVVSLIEEVFERMQQSDFSLESLNAKESYRPVLSQMCALFEHYHSFQKSRNLARYISEHFVGESLIHIGCGRGDLLEYLSGMFHSKAIRLIGTDAHCIQEKKEAFTFFNESDFSAIKEQCDTALILSYLERKSAEEVRLLLSNLIKLNVKRVIIEETVLISSQDLELDFPGMEELMDLQETQEKLNSYIDFPLGSQHAVATINAFLLNWFFSRRRCIVSLPPIALCFGTLCRALHLFSDEGRSGWKVSRIKWIGFEKGSLHGAARVLFILDRT